MGHELRQLIEVTISESLSPWLPGAAAPLSARAWKAFACHGFLPGNYGTHRWLLRDATAERTLLAELDLGVFGVCGIETLPTTSRDRYEELGLVMPVPTSPDFAVDAAESALASIALVPDLYATVAPYMRAFHLLEAPHAEIDVSHSDPEVPFSIFASIPPAGDTRKWRLAESIVHECMHLHLSMIEAVLPLVDDEHACAFSPWRQCARPLRGVLHGLYVSSVIDAYYRVLRTERLIGVEDASITGKRRSAIAHEVSAVVDLAGARGLTEPGRVLARNLLATFQGNKLSPA